MRVVATVDEVRRWRASCDGTVGLVPTMGYLHAGHLSLVRRAREACDHVAVSIFVNPTQFDVEADLERYPRDPARDRALLADEGVDLVFTPAAEEMYPAGFQTTVSVGPVAAPLEGAHRPGHFDGVATVVLKLLNIVRPDRAYFGRKDYQQLAVVRTMCRDLNVPVAIVGCPTVREPDGLAMSSRNSRLDDKERKAATVLYRALRAARKHLADGKRDADVLRATMRGVLADEPRARADYVSVADPDTLEELETVTDDAVLSLAVHIGPVRLIDNLRLKDGADDTADAG